jgi:hypothetical protein
MDSLHGEKELQHFFMNNGEIMALLREFSQAGYTKGKIKFKKCRASGTSNQLNYYPCRVFILRDSLCQAALHK